MLIDAAGEGIREYVNYLSVELLKRIVFASTGLRVSPLSLAGIVATPSTVACSKHTALFDEPIIKTTRAE